MDAINALLRRNLRGQPGDVVKAGGKPGSPTKHQALITHKSSDRTQAKRIKESEDVKAESIRNSINEFLRHVQEE